MSDLYSDAMLRAAAIQVRQSMLGALPHPKDCPCDMSPGQETKMELLVKKSRRITALRKVGKAVAAVILACLLAAGTWLTVNTEARAEFFQWVKEVYEDLIVYRFFGEPSSDELPVYRITGLPADYTETVSYEDETICVVIYESGPDIIVFSYMRMRDGSLSSTVIDNCLHEVVQLNSYTADLFVSTDPTSTNELIWIDEDQRLHFQLSSFHNPADMIELANNVTKTK